MSEEELKLAKAAYEQFKLTWMLDHNFTLADLVHELVNLGAESDPGLDLEALFAEWEFECGFGSQIWPCFEEFLECEYKEMRGSYMFPRNTEKWAARNLWCPSSKPNPSQGGKKQRPKRSAEKEI